MKIKKTVKPTNKSNNSIWLSDSLCKTYVAIIHVKVIMFSD